MELDTPEYYEDELEQDAKRGDWLHRLTMYNIIVLGVIYLAEAFMRPDDGVAAILCYMPQHPFGLPALVLLVWSLAVHRWKNAAINLAVLVLFAFGFMGLNVPITFNSAQPGDNLKVLTYNIHQGREGWDKITKLINDQQPDIACMQEAHRFYSFIAPLPRFYDTNAYRTARCGELLTISKYPIKLSRQINLLNGVSSYALVTEHDVNGVTLTVFNVHFAKRVAPQIDRSLKEVTNYMVNSEYLRSLQKSRLLAIANQVRGPIVIAGDFNTPPRGEIYGSLSNTYTDAFRSSGWGFGYTYHSKLPLTRIDYIFMGDGVTANSCSVPAVKASDHMPLVADIRIHKRKRTPDELAKAEAE